MARKPIKHGKKQFTPKGSAAPDDNPQDAAREQAMTAPGVPLVGDPGDMLGHDEVPGAGFAPH